MTDVEIHKKLKQKKCIKSTMISLPDICFFLVPRGEKMSCRLEEHDGGVSFLFFLCYSLNNNNKKS